MQVTYQEFHCCEVAAVTSSEFKNVCFIGSIMPVLTHKIMTEKYPNNSSAAGSRAFGGIIL